MSTHFRKTLALLVIATAFCFALRADEHIESHSASEWADAYWFKIQNFTGYQRLVITPESRFKLFDGGCFGSFEVNHGSVAYRNGVLTFDPSVPVERGSTYGKIEAMIPVRWNDQLYLVGTNRTGEFARAIHGDKEICDNYCWGFFVRESDVE